MLEVDMFDHLIQLSKTWDSRVKRPSIDSFSVLVQFGTYLYIFLSYTIANRLLEDCRAKMAEGDILDHITQLFRNSDSDVRYSALNTFSALAKFGTYLCFCDI